MNLIKTLEKAVENGEKIIKICNNTSFITMTAPVHTLAQELTESKIPALGVLSDTGKLSGIIISRTLFELLSKPYGRDLLFRKTAAEVMIKPRAFLFNEHISDVHEHLKEDFFLEEIQHYALIDTKRKFKGIFSSKDLLLHIAELQHQETLTTEEIQKKIIPPFLMYETDKFQLAAASVMSQRIGGDYYFAAKIDSCRTFFCLCDISGKGMSAALITAVIAGFMKTIHYNKDLCSIVQQLNSALVEACSLEKYATGIFCMFDSSSNTVEYCDMGHGLFFKVQDKIISQIQTSSDNIPAGVMNLECIITKKITLSENSVYIILSDGITEQKDENAHFFPIETIPPIINRYPGDLKKIKIDLLEFFFSFKKNTVQHDDASLLLFSQKKAL